MTLRGDRLREEILAKVREFYDAELTPDGEFTPGQSRVPYGGRVFDAEEVVSLVDSSLDFWLTYGRFSAEFERRISQWLGTRFAYLVNSGSSANLLAFASLTSDSLGERRIRRGDEVITVAAGFPTTVAPIVQFGAIPVFVDVEIPTYNASVEAVRAAITPKTKAIMLAHTLGNPFAAEEMRALADEHGIWLVEDNCDALGSIYRGRKTGTFGHIGTSSFYPPHHMTMGEGGAVYTDDPALAKIMLSIRDWGRDCICASGQDNRCGARFDGQYGTLPKGYDHKYVYSEWGYNLKVSDMQAAVGVAQLDKLDDFVAARRVNHAWLSESLAPLSDVLELPVATEGADPSWFGYLITVRDGAVDSEGVPVTRDRIVRAIEAAGVQTRMLFAGNLTRHPVFDSMRSSGEGYRVVGELTNTDRIMNDTFWVGVYPGLSPAMLEHMSQSLFRSVGR